MHTESQDKNFVDFETWDTQHMLQQLLNAKNRSITAVQAALPNVTQAVDGTVKRLQNGGRLFYIGAGTSGRLGVLDGSELLPTFGFPPDRTICVIAGGQDAFHKPVEGAEDIQQAGIDDMSAYNINKNDVTIGIAASGRTPYTVSAIAYAGRMGAYTIGIANNPDTPLLKTTDVGLYLATGAEPLAGSTRLLAGTAQKIVLNMFSTAVMAKLGHVYKGLMIDVQSSNIKLQNRRLDMLMRLTGMDRTNAIPLLQQCHNNVKIAVVVSKGIDIQTAQKLLSDHHGNLHKTLEQI